MQELGPLQREWVEALESGKYKQGDQYLCVGDRYCCLGVACELAGVEKTVIHGITRFDGWSTVLPNDVMREYGFKGDTGPNGEYFKGDTGEEYRSLASMNDNGMTFQEIADAVRADPAEFFERSV